MDNIKIELDTKLAQKFKLFCLIDYYIGKEVENWELTKAQSYPNGNVVLHVKLTKKIK